MSGEGMIAAQIVSFRKGYEAGEASVVDRQDQTGADCVCEGVKLFCRGIRMIGAQLGREVIGLHRSRGGKVWRGVAACHDVRQHEQLQGFDTVGQVGLHLQSPTSGLGIEPTAPDSATHRLSETSE